MPIDFKNKKVLVMGLGVLGGGVATTKWFVKHGAKVTVTDLRSRKELASSIRALGSVARRVRFVLGKHRTSDFVSNDIIVASPAIRRESPFLKAAVHAKKRIVNDAQLFFDNVKDSVVAITGTRGKTTTTSWIAHFLKTADSQVRAGGNMPDMPLLMLLERVHKPRTPFVVELSSWQLEHVAKAKKGPDIAVITNIYPDHLNRYRSMRQYMYAKSNIFSQQNKNQKLILNADNPASLFFLTLRRRKSKLYFFSKKTLTRTRSGIYINRGSVYVRDEKRVRRILGPRLLREVEMRGSHNVDNFLASALASYLMGISPRAIQRSVHSLPDIRYREEVVMRRKRLIFVNDSAATSPDATIAALRRFSNHGVLLITGGTDKKLIFDGWARTVKRHVSPENLFLLEGSATKKMIWELKKTGYFKKETPRVFRDLKGLLAAIRMQLLTTHYSLPTIILFSPGAASFELFKNEFDRGEKCNQYAKKFFKDLT